MSDDLRPQAEEGRELPALRDSEPEVRINPAVRFSVSRYVFSLGTFLAVVLFGFVSLLGLGVDLLPEFEVPVVAVSTSYGGAGPQEVDRNVSRRIEDAVSTLAGVSDISSTSTSGNSIVTITFNNGTNIDSAANSVSQAVAAIRGQLPSDTGAPVVQKFDPNAQPIISLAILPNGARVSEVTNYADDVLVPRLQRVAGVADVSVSGGPERQVQVLLDPNKLQAYNLTPASVTRAISASALDLPAGGVTQGSSEINFSTRNTPSTLRDVENIVVDAGRTLRVADVATVRDTNADVTTYARLNGQTAVLLSVRKASGENSVEVADNVRASLRGVDLPNGYRLVVSRDDTTVTRASVQDTYKELLISAVAVGVVVLLFLGRLNTVFAVILAIPISISAAPLLYGLLGYTLNIISLLAIIVAMGIVVDDSIVVAENVQRYRDKGLNLVQSVLKGASEVFSAVTAASFSLLAVLIPLSFIPGIIGNFFRQFGLGLAAAIALSWLEALLFLTVRMAYTSDPEPMNWRGFARVLGTFVPTLRWALRAWRTPLGLVGLVALGAALFLATRAPLALLGLIAYPLVLGASRYVLLVLIALLESVTYSLHGATEGGVRVVQNAYARSVARTLRFNGFVILGAVLFLASVLIPLRTLQFTFTPRSDGGTVSVNLTLPPGTSLNETNTVTRRLEEYLLRRPEVRLVSTTVGSGGFLGSASAQSASLNVTLTDKAERASVFDLVERYRADLENTLRSVPGANLTVAADQGGPGGGSSDLSLALSATNPDVLAARNREVLRALAADPNIASADSSLSEVQLERAYVPNEARLAGSGLTVDDLAQALRGYNEGANAGRLRSGGDDVDIVVKLNPSFIQGDQSLLAQTVYSSTLQANVPLGQFGSFQLRQAPTTIERYNKTYTSTLNINLREGAPNAFAYQRTIEDNLTRRGLVGNGVTVGNASSFGAAGLTGDLQLYGPIAVVLALLLNYLVLGSQFNSFRYPLYLLLPVPLAIIGGIWTLSLFGVSLDVITILGMVILIGLSTKNSILYLEFVVDRMKIMPLQGALVESARLRFRPIVMTTLTVVVISIPLILGTGEGAEFRRGLGIVILGGVLTSTLLTFYVVPNVFYRFERGRAERARREREGGSSPRPDRPALGTD